MLHPFLFTMVLVVVAVGLVAAHEAYDHYIWRDSGAWAEEYLPADSYEIEERGPVTCVVLTRALTVHGIPCAPGPISFDGRGRLAACWLARDLEYRGVVLRGGTQACFDGDTGGLTTGTLRDPCIFHGVPCAAGPVSRGFDGVLHAKLSRDATVGGIPCRGGTAIGFRTTLGPRPQCFTPRVSIERWGLRCAADHEIDLDERSGTLADDHIGERITLPAGSRFGHDIDRGSLWVRLARPMTVLGFELPADATIHPIHDEVFPERWLRRTLFGRTEIILSVTFGEPWSLAGVPVAAHQYVRILRSGHAEIHLDDDWFVGGLRYPAQSIVTVDPKGTVLRWAAGRSERAPHASPYR